MAVIEDKYLKTEGGIRKTIDQSSMPLALDILQRGLYAFPVQSTIRELVSNGRDAIVERDVAKAIISGKERVEDHFDVTKVDGIYHSSGWNPDYFDLDYLSSDGNVYIYYEEGTLKDKLRIVDNGVGLGRDRLVGYFQLNYSSKRTNKDSLGKWGLGSKVALSLNVPSFRVTSRYNGKKTAFDVFLDKVDPITPMFSGKTKNHSIELTPDCVAFYEDTDLKNGLEIEIEVKKHNKKQFFEAIESQLMYMPDIKFLHKEIDKLSYNEIDVAAKVLYRDANVIISESTIYDKPHILLGAGKALVNYGFISFNELEIEPKQGSVGLILDINDIEVTPSREAPIWSPKTREAVLQKYSDVSRKAADYINAELATEKDYLKWMLKAAQTMSALKSGNNDSVVGRLASIIDASAITNIRYPRDLNIEFHNNVGMMFGDKLAIRMIRYDKYNNKISRDNLNNLTGLSKPIYFTGDKADMYKDRYIYEDKGDFILIQGKDGYKIDTFAKYVLNSGELQSYDNVIVPEDILDQYKTVAISDDTSSVAASSDPRLLSIQRKLDNKIILHKLNYTGNDFVFSADESRIADLSGKFDAGQTVIYGTGNDRNDLKTLAKMFPANYLEARHRPSYNANEYPPEVYKLFYENETSLNMVITAEENKKNLDTLPNKFKEAHTFIIESFNAKTGKLVFTPDIKAIATAAVMDSLINTSHAKYFASDNFKQLDVSIHDYYAKFKQGWGRNETRPVRFANKTPFYRECIELAMIDNELLGGDKQELLDAINDTVPSMLCDYIGTSIKSVDILYAEPIKKLIASIAKYQPIKEIIELYANKYYYDDKSKKALADEIDKLFTSFIKSE